MRNLLHHNFKLPLVIFGSVFALLVLAQLEAIHLLLWVVWAALASFFVMRNKGSSFLLFLFFSGGFFLLNYMGSIQFVFLPQVQSLLENPPWYYMETGHIWAPRYLVVFPSVIMSELFQLELNDAFTLYNIIIFSVFVFIGAWTGSMFMQKQKGMNLAFGFISACCCMILSLFMNGRLVAAFLGIMIILYVQVKTLLEQRSFSISGYLTMFFGFFMSTVSSGTMMVSLLQIIAVSFLILRINKQSIKPLFYVCIVVFLGIGSLIIRLFMKNINYFGGGLDGILNMLSHGIGAFLEFEWKYSILAVIPLIIVLLLFQKYYMRLRKHNVLLIPIYFSIPICLFGGLFGISTGLMIIPSLIMVSAYLFSKNLSKLLG